MKVDFHIHITPYDLINTCSSIYKKEPYWKLLCESPNNKFATAEGVIEDLDKCGFDKGVIFGFSFKDLGMCRYVNDYTIEMVKKYPDRLVGMMAISPKSSGFEKEFTRCIDAGLKGVGEMFLSGQGIDPFNKGDLSSLMGLAMEADVPIIIHSNEPVGHYYVGKVEVTPREISEVVLNFPDNKLVLAHFGGGLPFYELMKEMKNRLKNTYYDTAAGIYLYDSKIFKVLKEIGILNKVIFGSDFPLLSSCRFEKYFTNSGLRDKELSLILGDNASKLLNL